MKALVKVVVVLVIILAAVVAGSLFYVDSIARRAIEYGGSEALGVPTTLERIDISLLGGKIELSNLKIANPPGFQSDRFLSLGSGQVAVSLGSLMKDTVIVPAVRLAGIRIDLEQSGKKNNVQPLLARTRGAAGRGGAAAETGDGGTGRKFVIEHFAIEDVVVSARLGLLGGSSRVRLVLPKIELRDLGRKQGGMTLPELIRTVVQTLLDAAASSSADLSPQLAALLRGELKGLDTVRGELVGKASAEVEKAASKVKKELQKMPLPPEVDKAVEEQAGKALEGLRGLFGDKK
ncbi:AsmA-like protein [Geothermobacter ehrlichii]|uniref:AsmA-like protein n=1 Tax=Geothermobacter ehrlichii TaxID=213224 RepID=A0A5D3WL69_9BACT|nr:AsmA family protein [Geothermobacter ehrlichii]TYO99875.1 AsmA-like protein [Geothermobacter ehrlichii]